MDTGSHNRGWAVGLGVLLGAGAALAFYPLARSTAASQAVAALGQRPEWLRAAYEGRGPRLERHLAAAADKVELQIAGASLLRAEPDRAAPDEAPAPLQAPEPAHVLARLDALARRFPTDSSLRAQQLRYLTQSAVWLKRPEQSLRPGQPLPSAAGPPSRRPSAEALARFAAAAAEGQRLEPGNAFFDQMRAAAAFIEGQDDRALGHLHAAAARPYWNDYTAAELWAQWRLLQAAYGDQGALQKLPSSVHHLFPDDEVLCGVAQMTRWHIARREHAGDRAGAWKLRGDLMRMGMQIADGSPLPSGKGVGAEIFDRGWEPVPVPNAGSRENTWTPEERAREREARRERYAASLDRAGQSEQAGRVRSEGERLDQLRDRARGFQNDGFFSPAFLWLVVWWMFGPLLLRQMLALLVLWGVAIGIGRVRGWHVGGRPLPATPVWLAIYLAFFLATAAWLTPFWPLPWNDLLSFAGALVLAVALTGLFALAQRRARRAPATHEGGSRAGTGPRWQPGLVAALCVLPSAALFLLPSPTFAADPAIRSVIGLPLQLVVFPDIVRLLSGEAVPGAGLWVLMPAVLPAALLAFLVRWRVVALGLPLRSGLARGVRRAAPYAVALLAVLYLVSLVPTIAADRALDQHLTRLLVDDPGSSTRQIR